MVEQFTPRRCKFAIANKIILIKSSKNIEIIKLHMFKVMFNAKLLVSKPYGVI